MPGNIVFTIVAKNYTGLACVLGEAVQKHSPGTRFVICIADELDKGVSFTVNGFDYFIAKDALGIEIEQWEEMAFKYNITEFCTAIKPYCFEYLLKKYDVENIIYFDPDIYIYSSLQPVWNILQEKDIIITPHITTPQDEYSGDILENSILATGIYNLGFLALRNTALTATFIKWWQKRLTDKSFADKIDGLYTDQKWIDFLPALFDTAKIHISKNLGLNIAPWNFYEREVINENGEWVIKNRITGEGKTPLIFFHFSGFNYKQLNVDAANKNIPFLKTYTDILPLISGYSTIIKQSTVADYFNYAYSYNYFSNGRPIMQFHRRLYRRLIEDGKVIKHPFLAGAGNTFYSLLHKAGLLVNDKDAGAEKLNERSFDGFEGKLYKINIFHKGLKRMLGAKNYFLFSKFMARYHRPENQVFLLKDEYIKNSYKSEHY